jgi:sulfoxide reductase heme-binding subunit YedZ
LALSGRARLERWPRIALEDLHRFASLAAGTFVTIHVVAIAIDAYLPFSLASLIVPFISSYRPVWVGIGIVTMELMVAVAISNRLRDRKLSYATWRKIHYATFAVWTGATIHSLGSGTDRSTVWLVAMEVVAAATVVGLLAWRIARTRMRDGVRGDVAGATLAGGAAAATLVLVLALGPLHAKATPWNAASFSDELNGRITRTTASTRGIVSLTATGKGDQSVLVRADLLIAPAHLESTSFQMEYLPSGDICRGTVARIADDGAGFTAQCVMRGGQRRVVRASWPITQGLELRGGRLVSSPG